MKSSIHARNVILPFGLVALSLAVYLVVFTSTQAQWGIEVASLAVIPVIIASLFFGVKGGILTAVLTFLANSVILSASNYPFEELWKKPGNIIGGLTLLVPAVLFGRLAAISRERKEALTLLEQYEKERDLHATFLEKLDRITALALESDNLQATLEILTEQLAALFHADDVFFAFWDAARETPIPTAAYGSIREAYPFTYFEPGETTPTSVAMKAGQPLAIEDMNGSHGISPRVASLYPSQSMLAIPLITQRHRLGAILLGYKDKRTFGEQDLFQAKIVAEQAALVLSKTQLLEDERKQVRQLKALHDVALTTTGANSEDDLIERVTDIIGNNLFPDNFGILLMDEHDEFLRPHPSYRSYKDEKLELHQIAVGKGITGQVAETGQSMRIGDVRGVLRYIDMDENTLSELCVPIRFKERTLGVVNAESTKLHAFSEEDERLLVTLASQLATAIEQLRREQAEHKWLAQLAHSNDLIYSIAHITTQIDRSLSEEETIRAMGSELDGLGLTCIMAVYDHPLKSFTINYTSLPPNLLEIVESGLGYPLLQYIFPRNRLELSPGGEGILRPTIISSPELEIDAIFTNINRQGIPRILQQIGVGADTEIVRLPLMFEENLLGVIWIWGERIIASDLPILSILAKQIGISLERARLFEEVQSLALTDPLTGLQNRRSVFELGRIEFSRARRMKHSFSCLMLDLDHFKKVNDKYGHQVGDQILQEFARRCLESVREGDLVGRYGGEELIILMPETDREMAVRVAERLQKRIVEEPFKTPTAGIAVTVSIGAAALDENTPHLEALIARADQALYIAKHKGRNRVAVSM